MLEVIYGESAVGMYIDRVIRDYDFDMKHRHTHEEYEIYYLVEGERYYFIENRIYHVKQGNLVLIDRNQIHKTGQYGDSHHERIAIELKEEPFSSFLSCTGELTLSEFFRENQGVLSLSSQDQDYVRTLLADIAAGISGQPPGYRLMTMAKLARLLFFAQSLRRRTAPGSAAALSTSATHQKVSEVASYICAHCAEASSLDAVGRRFFMSKSYLSRIFREITGYTVNEYINVNRIQQARRLLAESDLNITEISAAVGYESLTYFERIFRRHTEQSPLQYRKYHRPRPDGRRTSAAPQSKG